MRKKEKCKECGKELTRSALFLFINNMGIYEPFCIVCSRKKLRDEKFLDAGFMKPQEIRSASEIYNLNKMNTILATPNKLNKIINSKPYRDALKDMGFTDEEIEKKVGKKNDS